MPTDGAVPTKPQIKRQLVRMLENRIFTSRLQQAKLLKCLVRRTLAGKDVTEKSFRDQLYPAREDTKVGPKESFATSTHTKPGRAKLNKRQYYEEGSSILRRTVKHLQKSLWQYYTENESDALVVIHLPEPHDGTKIRLPAGETYKPQFRYNIHHQVSKDYLLGCHHLRSGYLNKIPDAVELFQKVLEREPEHAGAMLHIADAFCFMVGLGILPVPREKLIAWADGLVNRADAYAPSFWHTHATRALVHYCRGEFDAGQKEFNKALKLDREETESCSLYSLFLAANGRAPDALQLTEFIAAEQIDNPAMQAMYGFHLATARRYDEAEGAFRTALDLDRNCWMAHVGAMRLNLARGRTAQAQEHAERIKALLEPDEYEHWMAIIKALHGRG